MKMTLRNALVGLALLVGVGTVLPSCVVRARVVTTVDEEPPDPAPRYENPAPRAGFIWVRGYYERSSNQWVWRAGHWERSRNGWYWEDGRWDRRGNQWVWVRGKWVQGSGGVVTRPPVRDNRDTRPPVRDNRDTRPPVRDNREDSYPPGAPRTAPPSPQYKKVAAKRGFVWVRGHYEWSDGQWNWRDGHWERMKAGYRWQDGEWEDRGGYWVWVEGSWVQ